MNTNKLVASQLYCMLMYISWFYFVYVLADISFSRYNGSLPTGDRGRRKSRFALYRRAKANGVKPSAVHILNTPQDTKVG